jgi:hypothetical protein
VKSIKFFCFCQEGYVYFQQIKRPGASLENVKPDVNTTEKQIWLLRKLYALHDYNQNMGGFNLHAQYSSYYSTGQHYHERNWLPLFYMLIDAAVTNSYILCKQAGVKDGKKMLTHVAFQEALAKSLLRGPGAILRKRRPRPPKSVSLPIQNQCVKAPLKDIHGADWLTTANVGSAILIKAKGVKRKALDEISNNIPISKEQLKKGTRRTIRFCTNCDVPICYNSHSWEKHLDGV